MLLILATGWDRNVIVLGAVVGMEQRAETVEVLHLGSWVAKLWRCICCPHLCLTLCWRLIPLRYAKMHHCALSYDAQSTPLCAMLL